MGARGKRSAPDLTTVAVDVDSRPDPWPSLSELEQTYWVNIVKSLPAPWFRPSDLPLLAAYCKAAVRHDEATARLDVEVPVIENKPNVNFRICDMAIKQMSTLAGKLRICPSARYDPKQGHTRGKPQPVEKPWDFGKKRA